MARYIFIIQLLTLFFNLVLSNQNIRHTRYFRSSHDNPSKPRWYPSKYSSSPHITKVNLKVYYETLCPASVEFFTTQLRPVMEKLRSHVDVHLIPYGHAKTLKLNNHFIFRCQHGPPECYGNRLHACAIDAIEDKAQAVVFNACLMQYSVYDFRSGYNFLSALNWCGYKLDVLINGIWECVNSKRGSVLLKGYGEETHELRPHYVPYVILNNSTNTQDQATGNLMRVICNMLNPTPRVCYDNKQ